MALDLRSATLTRPARVALNRCSNVRVFASAVTAKISIIRNPPEDKLKAMGVRSWPTWGCEPSKFPWTYSDTETAFVLEGEVVVTPVGDVKKRINKHYHFG